MESLYLQYLKCLKIKKKEIDMIYFVATPIGNLSDISYRAIKTLQQCDVIFCEDTRVSSVLLSHYDISKPLYANHKFNEAKVCDNIIKLHMDGKNIAIISDSGCPIISDPGLVLAKKLNELNIKYTVIPGANAGITALMLSGFDSYHFAFMGFLPEKNVDRKNILENIKNFEGSIIFYISPHSLQKDINSIFDVLGKRNACLVKEITKIYEQTVHFVLGEPFECNPKGEFVLVVQGCSKQSNQDIDIYKQYDLLLSQGEKPNKAISLIAKMVGKPRNEIYQIFKGKS